jgi:hypothetical protein
LEESPTDLGLELLEIFLAQIEAKTDTGLPDNQITRAILRRAPLIKGVNVTDEQIAAVEPLFNTRLGPQGVTLGQQVRVDLPRKPG